MATLKPAERHRASLLDLTVHVIPACPAENLDEGDLDDHGNCVVDGAYRLSLRLPEGGRRPLHDLALEAFHALHGVYEPSLFRFVVSTRNDAMDGVPRRDLGAWHVLDDQPVGMTRVLPMEDGAGPDGARRAVSR